MFFHRVKLASNIHQYHYRNFHVSPAIQKLVQFLLSDIGEGIKEVTVSEWFIKEGDKVSQFDNICSVESDKASVNITSRYDGQIKKLHYSTGEIALVGKPLVDIETNEEDDYTSSSEDEKESSFLYKHEPEPTVNKREELNLSDIYANKTLATPAVRRIAIENNVNLSKIKGSGKGGRIMKEDILSYLKKESSEQPKESLSIEIDSTKPVTGIQKIMFKTMTKSHLIPSFNYYEEVDVTKLVRMRKEIKDFALSHNIKLTYMPFFIKALSKALEKFPLLNSSLDDSCENIIYKSHHNVGLAVDTKMGLIVPNIKNVQTRSIINISKEIQRLLEEGREGHFNPSDLKGGTITISNVGAFGGTYATPLILPPEVVIVALGKIKRKPIINANNEVQQADILYTSWTADHRIIDGATLSKFVSLWKQYLETPSFLTLDL